MGGWGGRQLNKTDIRKDAQTDTDRQTYRMTEFLRNFIYKYYKRYCVIDIFRKSVSDSYDYISFIFISHVFAFLMPVHHDTFEYLRQFYLLSTIYYDPMSGTS